MYKNFLETGQVVGTHAIHGEIRVQPWCDAPEFLKNFKEFYLDENGESSITALEIRPHGNIVIMKIKDVNTVEEANHMRGKVLYIDRSEMSLEKDRYFVQDLIDCKVYNEDTNEYIGIITDVSATGANDVWHILKDDKEYLIPAIDEVVISVDVTEGIINIIPLKGIFEDED